MRDDTVGERNAEKDNETDGFTLLTVLSQHCHLDTLKQMKDQQRVRERESKREEKRERKRGKL